MLILGRAVDVYISKPEFFWSEYTLLDIVSVMVAFVHLCLNLEVKTSAFERVLNLLKAYWR